MRPVISGLHHVTAIASDPRRNADFYTRVLGMRLVKRTVNFDEPDVYHLYYGDATGRPGTILTFFVRLRGANGRPGNHQVTGVRFSVPEAGLDGWNQRLTDAGVSVGDDPTWCGSPALSFRDPEGLALHLVGDAGDRSSDAAHRGQMIRGLHSVELTVPDPGPTSTLLTAVMGLEEVCADPERRRFAAAGDGPGRFVDVRTAGRLPEGSMGSGCVHHVAFRAASGAQQRVWQARLRARGLAVTAIKDRKYFRSIYFHEPRGIRLEIATDGPGFAVDEPLRELGRRLQLPASLEPVRRALEDRLETPPVTSA